MTSDNHTIHVIIDENTILRGEYKTERAAKAGITRLNKKRAAKGEAPLNLSAISKAQYITIRPMKTVRNLMTGVDITIPVDTPRICDPSTELYWSA